MTNNREIQRLMNNPTSTTNKLHFEDLDWRRFEQLTYEILYREKKWERLDPIGLKGNDDGVDILGVDKEGITWYIQCKNWKAFAKSDAEEVIDTIVAKQEIAENSVLLIVVACEVSLETRDYIKSYSMENGFKDHDVWTGLRIKTMLFDKYNDILSRYLGIETENSRNKEKVLQSRKMRNKVEKKLLRKIEWNHNTRMEIARDPSKQFRYEKVVIRSIDDVDDPYGENACYYEICPYQLAEVGIELLDHYWDDSIIIAINIDTRCWRIVKDDDELMENEFDVRADHMVLLPYYSIVDIKEEGDDYSDYPVLLCNFEFNQTPFLRRYYKHKPSKADFIKGKPLSSTDFALLIDEVEKEYGDGISNT